MKKSVLLLSFICLACVAMGQTNVEKYSKEDIALFMHFRSDLQKLQDLSDTTYIFKKKPDTRRDTAAVLFQEAVVQTNGRDTIVIKHWADGYVVWSNEPVYVNGVLCRCFKINSYYLYADKKTRVTNQVLKSIDR